MTIPSPYVPVAGDDATQARVLTWADAANFLLGSTISDGSRRPLAVMRQTVSQNLTSGVDAAISFDFEDVDYQSGHSTVTNTSRYVAPFTGWYDIDFLIVFVGNATGLRAAYLKINASTVVPASFFGVPTAGAAVNTGVGGSRKVFLNAGDFLEVMGSQNSGGVLGTQVGAQTASMFCAEWRSN